jgi:putative ubiquitin-RnfH superfamily antitoxin RatB of RatAB toxin-antitoxin module
MGDKKMKVEVVYALPDKQKIIAIDVPEGTVAFDAVQLSGIGKQFPDINIEEAKMGVFGKAVKPKEHVLSEGERVEIYRPLKADPKASRAARAEKAKANRAESVD